MNKCVICSSKKKTLIWDDKIRVGVNKFSRNKKKIYQCINCEVVSLDQKNSILENSAIARNIYNKDNTTKEFIKFHKPRELKKLKFIEKNLNLKNKYILESNCGAGIILDYIRKKTNNTYGLDDKIYKDYLLNKKHSFYNSLDEIIKDKLLFDVVFSFSELEHKKNPLKFLKKMNKIIRKNGKIILRIPNYNNIYKYLLGYNFLKYDFRESHNYYFSEKNLDKLFKRTNFNIILKKGFNEYDFNHLLTYIKKQKRVKEKDKINYFSSLSNLRTINNIQDNFVSTSLIYILQKK